MQLFKKLSGIVTHSLPLNRAIEVHEYLLATAIAPQAPGTAFTLVKMVQP